MDEKRDIRISKSLSYLLRHGAVKEKLNMDESGKVLLSELLAHNRLKCNHVTIEDIERVVETNNKKRFSLIVQNGQTYIFANQGHSFTITDENLEQLTLDTTPLDLFHGTYGDKVPLIVQQGLKKMNRNHIHFTDAIAYVRPSCNALIYIDVAKCYQDGIVFYRSLNNVYLTEGIDGVLASKYFKCIVDRKSGNILKNI